MKPHLYLFPEKSHDLGEKYTSLHSAAFNMHLKPALSPIIFRRAVVQCYHTLNVLNLLNMVLCKHFSALTRDGELPSNSKTLGGLL